MRRFRFTAPYHEPRMNGIKTNGSATEWSGVEHVPRTLASCWHLLGKRIAELEMHGFNRHECSRVREAIDHALNAVLGDRTAEPKLVAIRWQGSRKGFDLSIDGQPVITAARGI